ncbi:MAG: alpha/beta hydrolase [Candidatus Melainabacteria bacterium]
MIKNHAARRYQAIALAATFFLSAFGPIVWAEEAKPAEKTPAKASQVSVTPKKEDHTGAMAKEPTHEQKQGTREVNKPVESNEAAVSIQDSQTDGDQPNPQMQAVLDAQKAMQVKPLIELTPEEARQQPSIFDALKKMADQSEAKKTGEAAAALTTANIKIPTNQGEIKARVYKPAEKEAGNLTEADEAQAAARPLPVIVYYHGGGWVLGDLDTYDASARALAESTEAIVVSVDYRHAPEHPLPAAYEDAFAAYQYVLKNVKSMGGDPARVAIAGESAGGNIAANVTMAARDAKLPLPVHQLLIYPVAGTDMTTGSYTTYSDASPLSKAAMGWFFKQALRAPGDIASPRLNLTQANLKGLPPTTVITAEIDPLKDDGVKLARTLKENGVAVDYKNYKGVTHEFFGMSDVVDEAREAQLYAADQLKSAFAAVPGSVTQPAESQAASADDEQKSDAASDAAD